MKNKNLTPKGKLIDGCYYSCKCPRCGNIEGAYIRSSNILICSYCNNHEGVKLRKIIKENSRTNCPKCGKKKNGKYLGWCPECTYLEDYKK